MRQQFVTAIVEHQAAFGINLPTDRIERLADYYDLIQEHNPLLHLVAPMGPGEFAIRHILESLTLLEFLPAKTKLADVGTGAGLPSIPCLLVRDDLSGVLIESKIKKARFLETAIESLGLAGRIKIVNRQFEEAEPTNCQFVTCRALDKFTEKLPRLIKWSGQRGLLFFGGRTLEAELKRQKVRYFQKRMPMSEQRYLFVPNLR